MAKTRNWLDPDLLSGIEGAENYDNMIKYDLNALLNPTSVTEENTHKLFYWYCCHYAIRTIDYS